MPMRIVIDLQACQSESRFRGIGRYSMFLTKAMAKQAGKHEILLFLSDRFPETIPAIRLFFDDIIPKEHIIVFSAPGPVAGIDRLNRWRSCAAELIREHALLHLKPDIVYVMSLFEGWDDDTVSSVGMLKTISTPVAVTLYDIIPFVHKEIYLVDPHYKNWYYRKLISLKNANILLAISEYSKQEAIAELGLNEDSVVNIFGAIDEHFKPLSISNEEKNSILNRYNITKPFIMCAPGGFDSRKNIERLINAYVLLQPSLRDTHQLVITSKIPKDSRINLIEQIYKAGLSISNIILTGYVPDDDLIALYNLAKLFVFPSLAEGFGLPALEAMACGAAVIGSGTTSIPEIIGRKDALFDPTNTESITQAINNALIDENFLQSLREYGLKRAKEFSWDDVAKRALEAFEMFFLRNLTSKTQITLDANIGYKELIHSITHIEAEIPPTEADLLNAAECISLNTLSQKQKEIFIDISELVRRDAKTGIQRVVRNILQILLKYPPKDYQVKAVYFDGQCYRYADKFINSIFIKEQAQALNQEQERNINQGQAAEQTQDRQDVCSDSIIDAARGDIFFCPDVALDLLPAAKNTLRRYNNLDINVYFVVYDILPILHPEWWTQEMHEIMRQWLQTVAEVSTGIVCNSMSTANDIKAWLAINPPDRAKPLLIGYFYLGADIENEKSQEIIEKNEKYEKYDKYDKYEIDIKEKNKKNQNIQIIESNKSNQNQNIQIIESNKSNQNKNNQIIESNKSNQKRNNESNENKVLSILQSSPSFLMVGTIEPRKGHTQTLDSFEQLWKIGCDINLVIVGKAGWMVETLIDKLRKHSKLGKHLFWLEGIGDEYLEKVYAASACLIAASEGEGFGLPLIEAARHKLPIIVRDIPVFREVAGEHAFYFKGSEPIALTKAIQKWLTLHRKRKEPKSDNIPWLTWKQSTEQLEDIIFNDKWYYKFESN